MISQGSDTLVTADLVRKLFTEDELVTWFGTKDIHDDTGDGCSGTLIGDKTFAEIQRRFLLLSNQTD